MRKEREVYFGKKDVAGALLDLAEKLAVVLQDEDVELIARQWALAHTTLLVKLAKSVLRPVPNAIGLLDVLGLAVAGSCRPARVRRPSFRRRPCRGKGRRAERCRGRSLGLRGAWAGVGRRSARARVGS